MESSFQFHTGSIKRLAEDLGITEKAVFQFHTGSIKRRRNRNAVSGIDCFNSTLVRLKGTAERTA